MAGMEEAEDEDEDESRLELCDRYFVEGKSEESDESEEDGLAKDPDFTSCGTRWLDSEDSCHRSLQIALQRAKCRCIEAQVKLEKRKAGNLKKALRDWDAGHTGDNAEGCDSGVAVKKEGSQIIRKLSQTTS